VGRPVVVPPPPDAGWADVPHPGDVPTRADELTRTCLVCGREMTWRKAWARTWDEVRYCSDACRRTGISDADRALEAGILDALRSRRRGAVLDPEQVVVGEREAVRRAARRLAARGEIEVVQGGRLVDPSHAKGAFGVRLLG